MFKKLKSTVKIKKTSISSPVMDDIIRAGSLLTGDMNYKHLVSVLVEQSLDVTLSNLAVFYAYSEEIGQFDFLRDLYKRGNKATKDKLSKSSSLVQFIEESSETVIVLNKNENSHFPEIILNDSMHSAIALPISTVNSQMGILILNSKEINFYNNKRFQFLDSLSKLASGMLNNARLFNEMKESYKKIESLERYQDNIFSSMSNLLLTLDSSGNIHYANEEAMKSFQIDQSVVGLSFHEFFGNSFSKSILRSIGESIELGVRFPGLQGIYRDRQKDIQMDFKLNISPLMGSRGKKLGTILIFANESKERELQKQMTVVTEERRQIKDMFSRYLSHELVNNLIEKPELVKPGADQKRATVLFADIRGYTSFSEGRDPAYIIEILNEYFNEAVEKVISSNGYIDKFIGDCIMAAWGVPMMSEEEDAINAVTCALEIQKLIKSSDRQFFQGDAHKLKVGIGMHTGYLIAGNLGSSRRMDYTIIGDTVNVAARLEGVAEAGEIIITQSTRDKLSDHFKLEKRTPVQVKGKSKPIIIYNVLDRIK